MAEKYTMSGHTVNYVIVDEITSVHQNRSGIESATNWVSSLNRDGLDAIVKEIANSTTAQTKSRVALAQEKADKEAAARAAVKAEESAIKAHLNTLPTFGMF